MMQTEIGIWLIYFTAVAGVFGLLIGSFLNVVVYRVPNGMSIVSPASSCPGCGSPIKRYDNVPVISWLLLRGRCRGCTMRISKRYPLVELGTGVAFAVVTVWLVSGVSGDSIRPWRAYSTSVGGSTSGVGSTSVDGLTTVAAVLVVVAFLYLAAISVALGLIDLDTHKLPNAIVLPSYIVGAVLLGAAGILSGNYDALLRAGIGMAALWVAYFLMAIAYPGGMGLGDVKLAGLLGLFLGYLGWGQLAVGAFAAFLLGGIFSLVLIIARRAARKSGIPFGPWMLAGAWVGALVGGVIWSGYLSLLGVA